MLAIIKFFNYRKDIEFEILGVSNNLDNALFELEEYAENEFGLEKTDEFDIECVTIKNKVYGAYTQKDGYQQWIYAVIAIP